MADTKEEGRKKARAAFRFFEPDVVQEIERAKRIKDISYTIGGCLARVGIGRLLCLNSDYSDRPVFIAESQNCCVRHRDRIFKLGEKEITLAESIYSEDSDEELHPSLGSHYMHMRATLIMIDAMMALWATMLYKGSRSAQAVIGLFADLTLGAEGKKQTNAAAEYLVCASAEALGRSLGHMWQSHRMIYDADDAVAASATDTGMAMIATTRFVGNLLTGMSYPGIAESPSCKDLAVLAERGALPLLVPAVARASHIVHGLALAALEGKPLPTPKEVHDLGIAAAQEMKES